MVWRDPNYLFPFREERIDKNQSENRRAVLAIACTKQTISMFLVGVEKEAPLIVKGSVN
jgi:hypothetical protein